VNDSTGASLVCSPAATALPTASKQTIASDRAKEKALYDIGIARVYQTFDNSPNGVIQLKSMFILNI
jgi:hypothetical protein